MQPREIEEIIKNSLPDAEVFAEDMTGTGNHYRVEVSSEAFKGKSRIESHKIINDLFSPQLADGSLHALSLRTIGK